MKKTRDKKDNITKGKNFWLNLWGLLAPSKKRMKTLGVLIVVFESSRLVGPYVLKMIIDKLVNFNVSEVMPIVYLVLLLFLSEEVNSILHYFKDRIIFKLLIDVEYYLPTSAQKRLVFFDLSYHERENTGSKITKIEHGVQRIVDLLSNMSWEVVPTMTQLFVTVVVLFIVDWRFGLSLVFFSPLFVAMTYKVNKDLQPLRRERHRNYEIASGKMGQSIININTVKSFVQENRETKEYSSIREMIKRNEFKEWFKLLNFGLGRNLIIDLGRITILLLGVYLVWHSKVSIGTLVFVITLSEKSYFALYRLSRFYDKVEDGAVAVERFVKLTKEESEVTNPEKGIVPKKIIGEVEFKDVSFAYKNSGFKALNKINFKINSDCITALVGPSGGGKTTVARMIYRHYDPQAGAVLLDGQNLRDYDLYGFRKFIAIVPQEVEIFDYSVRDNIAYANPKASLAEIKAAAKIANAEEFICQLSENYDTLVGERGIKLSGGQRQRIGIARAVLANPRILIFDEATSNLDSKSERLIQEAMQKISRGRTVVIIAHRLSTIKRADKIIVLEDGRVVEEGSHYQLADKKGGLYSELLKLQRMGEFD